MQEGSQGGGGAWVWRAVSELYFRGTVRHIEPKRNAIHPMYISTESLRQPRGEAAIVGQGRGGTCQKAPAGMAPGWPPCKS